jgi:uncharacterized protein YbjT (DUF2867 family)
MIVVAGGEPRVREAVLAAAEEAETPARALPEGASPELTGEDALVDLGLPPAQCPAGDALAAAEAQRAAALAAATGAPRRVVRVSVIGAGAGARTPLQRAQHAAEEAWRHGPATVTVLRPGILLGDCGLAGGLRRVVEASKIVPLPGVWRAKLEPLLVDDLGRYCVDAAVAEEPKEGAFDLGCGELLTGGLLARGIADNLGVSRWVWSVPGLFRGAVVGGFAGPAFPAAAVRHWLDALAGGLLPGGVGAWKAFRVQPVDLRLAMAYGVGMKYGLRSAKGRFGAWKAPERKGILGQKVHRRR